MSRKPNGYWTNWDNLVAELSPLIQSNNGIIPSQSVLNSIGKSSISSSISYFGGKKEVEIRLGIHGLKFCKECSITKPKDRFRIRKKGKERFHNNICNSCSAAAVSEYRASWPGRAAELFRRAKERSPKNGVDCNLTKEFLLSMLLEQEYCCAVTGISLVSDTRGHGVGFQNRYGASIDRIDSSGGYTTDNVRIVCNRINIALGDLTDDQFEEFAIGFVQNRGYLVNKV